MDKNGKLNFHNYQKQQINSNPNSIIPPQNNFIPNNKPIIPVISNINSRQNNNFYNNMNPNNLNINTNNQIINQNSSIPPNQIKYDNTKNLGNYQNNNIYNNNINNNYGNQNLVNNLNGNIIQQMRPPSGNNNINKNYQYNQNISKIPIINNNYNPNSNINYGYNKINKISESKELKLKKQEEYRKELDDQMKYEIEKKERERQIKYGGGINGLGSLNNINSNNKIMNYNNAPINNNMNNGININPNNNNLNNNNPNIINNNNDIKIPDINNNTITRPNINQEEKEKLRRKQMEYNEILRQQVEERNKMKEIAKQKEKEEEIKFEEKLKRQLLENQKRAELIKNNEYKNNKYAHNLESPENFMANPMSTMPIPQMNIQGQNNQINNMNPNYTAFGGFYGNNNDNNLISNKNNTLSMNSTNKYSTIDAKTDIYQSPANPNIQKNINSNNINNNPNNYFNITPSTNTNTNNLYQIQNTPQNYVQRPTPSQTITAFGRTSKTNTFNNNNTNTNMNQNFQYSPETNNKASLRPTSQQGQRRARNDTWRMEELYMNFVQEQLKIINEYEMNINKYQSLKKDNFDTIKDLMTIKNKALDKIQEAQNKFKDTIGVYPMDNNFNNRVTNLMDMMLEKKINDIQRENKLEILANNFNKQKRNEKNNGRQKYNNINDNYNDNGIQLNDMNNDNNEFIPITESQINRNIIGCGYKSKYEELKMSMINGTEASQELRTSMSLAGYSKLVKQNKLVEKNENNNIIQDNSNNNVIDNNNNYENMYCNINNGQSNLYTTWNSEKFPEEEQNNIININKNSPLNTNENTSNLNQKNNQEIIDTTVNKNTPTQTHINSNPNNKKLNHRRNMSKGILNDSQLPSKIVGNDKGLFNHANDEMSGSNISMQESNSNINYINGSDLNIDHPFNSPSPTLKYNQISDNNTLPNNDTTDQKNGNKMTIGKNLKNMKLTKEEKDKSLLMVGDNIIKNNLTHGGYSQREKENKEKSYLIGNITTLNNNMNDNTLINNTNQNFSANNTFTHMNTNTNNNLNKSQESENNLNKDNENISLGVTIPSKKNGGLGENNETDEDMVRGFGPSGMNSMLNDENTSNYNHSNNNSGMSAINIMNKNTFGKKKVIVNTNKEIQQIKEAEEKEEEENYAYDFTLDNKTLKKLEEEEKSQNSKKINLDDYKAIKESQKIQTQLNFFEDSVLENINISKSKAKGRIIKSYNMLGNKNKNIIKNLTNELNNNNNDSIENSNSKKSNNTNNNTNIKRPQSPKYIRNNNKQQNNDENNYSNNNNGEISQNNRNNMSNFNENSSLTNLGNDSYGDHIINDLNKYRKMFLEESSMD